jgi:hypothetical protein
VKRESLCILTIALTIAFLAMKKTYMLWDSKHFLLILFFLFVTTLAHAQSAGCVFKDPLIRIDFGNDADNGDINLSLLKRYNRMEGGCPDDGNYSFASYTENCFTGHWHSLPADHTGGDDGGRMMIVNASERPGQFFMLNIAGLKPGATYEFANWIVNICRSGYECTTIPPLIKVSILTGGRVIKSFVTGEIYPEANPIWKRYSAEFTLPIDVSAITLQMEDENPGGCGNDFALDDITLRECILPQPVIVKQPEPAEQKSTAKAPPAVAKKTVTEKPVDEPTLKRTTTAETPLPASTPKKEVSKIVAVPKPIASRENPVIRQIKVAAGELMIELYDNGQIDGDTVSIFHNNQLIRSRASLSEKPVTIKIKLDKEEPHHELIMVAENLGSIPPNTSLMIITAKNKRYEIFISSSEQKNAKIVIDLEE